MEIEKFFKEIPVLETERLIYRKIELNDVDDLFEIFSDKETMYCMTWEVNKTKEDTLNKFIKVINKRHEQGQSVDWAIVTGGASGIGRAICNELVQQNVFVIISDINEQAGKNFEAEALRKLRHPSRSKKLRDYMN